MIGIAGMGWAVASRFGTLGRGLSGGFEATVGLRDELLERGILPHPIKRFAKLDGACRMATLVAGLALYDARLDCAPDRPVDVGVLGTNEAGCLQTNRGFYEDFVEHGRKRGRGSLFVYTLASMPASEVSMHFKLTGPTAWIGSDGARARVLLERAAAILRRRETEAIVALDVSESGGIGFLLRPAARGDALADLSTVLDWTDRNPTPERMLQVLTNSDGRGPLSGLARTG